MERRVCDPRYYREYDREYDRDFFKRCRDWYQLKTIGVREALWENIYMDGFLAVYNRAYFYYYEGD